MIKSVLTGKNVQFGLLTNIDLFKSLGLNEEWLMHPIIIVREGMINLGVLGNNTPNGQNLYLKLKQTMPNTIDDL